MKRTSLWLALLALTPGIADARHFYVSPRYRTHYSPYAFSYRSSGFVPGGTEYSSHAFNYRNSGLVLEGVRYTPYLLSYGSSGLIVQYYGYAMPCRYYGPVYVNEPCPVPSRPPRVCPIPKPTGHPVSRAPDGIQTIREYLQARGYAVVNMNHVLRIDNQLVSVEFFLKDQNLIIKYWNPDEIESLGTKEAFKLKAYEKYVANWTQIAAQHEQTGGQIYSIEASDAQTIVAALDSCKELSPNPSATGEPVLYAKD